MMSVIISREARAIMATAMIIAVTLAGCGESETAAEKARRKAEDNAWVYCLKAAVGLEVPVGVRLPLGLGEGTSATGGGYLVAGDVKLMNAFGAMITHKYVCQYKDGRALFLSLAPE